MKKILVGCALIALLPFAASAATAEELTAQIQALLQQVQALQQQYGSPVATPAASNPATAAQCPLISRSLKKGASGDDVTRLQQFLARDVAIYPEAMVTGYYGALTEAAVKRFQCKNQIVCDGTPESTGYGVTGPRTAALLALQCSGSGSGSGANVGGFIKVTPISGAAPLTVSVEATVNTTKSCGGATYEVFYGDNSAPVMVTVPPNVCNEMKQTFSHLYASGGTYTITLRSGIHQTTATVVVSGPGAQQTSSTDSFSANPKSGGSPLSVTFTGTINATAACSPGTYSINFGDGQSANLPLAGCVAQNYVITHVYGNAGNYVARLTRGGTEIGSASIAAGGGASSPGGGAFSVTPGYGGDAFAVQATFALASSCTAYDLDWGDGSAHASQAQGSCAAGGVTKEVSHTYSATGTFTATLLRGSGSGQTTDTVGISVVY
jgi:PKD repeat protein